MYTVSKDSALSVDLIKNAIEFNEQGRSRYDKLEDYYLGEQAILKRKKNQTYKNNKLVVNHARYITDINIGYLLGNKVEYQVTDGFDIEVIKDEFKKQTISDLDHEIAKDLSIFGRQYELVYNVDNEVRSKDIDVRNAICVYDDTVEHNKLFGIIYKLNDKGKYEDIVVYDDKDMYECSYNGDIRIGKERPHSFGKVPLIEYRNNSENQGDFEQVISLIDAYNILQSDRLNDKEQLVEAIMVGYGVTMTPEQMEHLRMYRTLFLNTPKTETQVEYLVKNLDESQVDILRQTIQEDIHKISMTPNMSDENFVGNSSGVAIRFKLLAFEQSISNKERYFEKGLLERFELYNNYLVSLRKMSLVPRYEVDAVFKRNLPQNDFEISQMINNLAPYVDDATLVEQLSFIDDAERVVELNRKEEKEEMNKELAEFGSSEPSKLSEEENAGNN
jgi:SPP1 family phage portal protein